MPLRCTSGEEYTSLCGGYEPQADVEVGAAGQRRHKNGGFCQWRTLLLVIELLASLTNDADIFRGYGTEMSEQNLTSLSESS